MAGEVHEVAEQDGHVLVAVGDQALPSIEPHDDRLGQDVAEQISRPGPFPIEVVHHPVEELGVRVPHGLGRREGVLELIDAASEPRVLSDQIALAGGLAHEPRRTVTNVSLRKRLVVPPPIGAISPAQ